MLGQMVAQYRVLEEIGRGSMGIVFKAQDVLLGRTVALKILAEKLVNDPEMLHRFEREGAAAAALNHPNICNIFEAGNWNGRPYLAMELLFGHALDQILAAGPLNEAQLNRVATDAAGALEAAHAIGVVHRDIKPANLFFTTSGTVKVLDFGLAKAPPPPTHLGDSDATVAVFSTRAGTILGTLANMSPEQVCREPLDDRADLYSLGVVLYELATGRLPDRVALDVTPLPEGLRPIVAKLIKSDPRQRYQSAGDLRDALMQNTAIASA